MQKARQAITYAAWVYEVLEAPQRVQDRALVGPRRRSPRKILKFCILRSPDEAKNITVYLCTEIQGQKKNSSSSGTYEKRQICSIHFHKFSQVETGNKHANFLACAGTNAVKFDQRFFLRNLIHKYSDDLHEIDNTSNEKPKQLPKIPVACTGMLLMISMSLQFELPKSFPVLCQTNKIL